MWELDLQRLSMERISDAVLCAWGLLNLLAAGVWLIRKPSDRARGFWIMGAGFGAVNLALGLTVLIPVLRSTPGMPAVELFERMNHLCRLFALSCGLDVAYGATGWMLWERGLRKARPLLIGMGQSLLVQASVLLAFDAVLFALHDRLGGAALQWLLQG